MADDPDGSESIRAYLVAKAIADGYLQRSGASATIGKTLEVVDGETPVAEALREL